MDFNKSDYVEVAKQIMELIQLDNGYGHFEGISYPKKWIKKISKAASVFFEKNPELLNDDVIDIICTGGEEDNEKFIDMVGYNELNKILNDYFDNGMDTGIVEIKPRIEHTYKRIKGKK